MLFKAMHMFYVLSYFSGCTGSNEASNLGVWQRSSFGRLRGTSLSSFPRVDCFSYNFRSSPLGLSITTG